jgi:hypothetical protein
MKEIYQNNQARIKTITNEVGISKDRRKYKKIYIILRKIQDESASTKQEQDAIRKEKRT